VLEGLLARQHRRQHDPVVVDPGLGAEDGDLVAIGGALEDLLDRPAPGHAVADDDQLLLVHTDVLHACASASLAGRRSDQAFQRLRTRLTPSRATKARPAKISRPAW